MFLAACSLMPVPESDVLPAAALRRGAVLADVPAQVRAHTASPHQRAAEEARLYTGGRAYRWWGCVWRASTTRRASPVPS